MSFAKNYLMVIFFMPFKLILQVQAPNYVISDTLFLRHFRAIVCIFCSPSDVPSDVFFFISCP